MNKFLEIMFEEFKRFTSEKGVMLIMIVAVILYSFWYAMPYNREVIKDVPIGIVDLDETDFSRDVVRDLDVTDVLDFKQHYLSIHDAERDFFRGKLMGFIVVPKDFQKDILRGKQVNVSLYADSAYLVVYKTIYSAALQAALENGARLEVGRMMKTGIPKKQAIAVKQPFEFISVPLFNPVGGYKSYVYPVILVMILHQTLIMGLGMLQGTRNQKKEKYTLDPKDIPFTLLARSTMYVLMYLFYGSVAFLIFPSLFVYPSHYNLIPLFLVYILFLYCVAFFAQTISYWFRMRESVLLIMVVTSLIFVFIPGLIWPRESIPEFINIISFLIPGTCGVDAIIKLNQNGASFINILYDYLWLMFLTIAYFISAVYLTKKSDSKF